MSPTQTELHNHRHLESAAMRCIAMRGGLGQGSLFLNIFALVNQVPLWDV